MLQTKTDKALRTIGEAADILGVATHVIRFWESSFTKLKPIKYNGRRYYSPEHIHMLGQIKTLLHKQKFSIKEAASQLDKPKHQLIKIRERLIKARDRLSKLITHPEIQESSYLN